MDGPREPEAAPTTDQPLTVEVLAHVPTEFYHCAHCEVVFRDVGPKVHDEQRRSAVPDDLARQYAALSEWAHDIYERFGSRVALKLTDVASFQGFFKSLRRNLHRYPAFIIRSSAPSTLKTGDAHSLRGVRTLGLKSRASSTKSACADSPFPHLRWGKGEEPTKMGKKKPPFQWLGSGRHNVHHPSEG